MIDPSLFTVERLLATMLDDMFGNVDRWRKFAEIVLDYRAPFAAPDEPAKVVVRYTPTGGRSVVFLRYSKGPRQGYSWDIYGDNFHTPELALLALLQAPVPPSTQRAEEWAAWAAAEEAAREKVGDGTDSR